MINRGEGKSLPYIRMPTKYLHNCRVSPDKSLINYKGKNSNFEVENLADTT